MSSSVAHADTCAHRNGAHAESEARHNLPLEVCRGDAFVSHADLQTARSLRLTEAWKALDETHVAYQPALPLPPADLDTRETSPWLEPVRFFGEPVRYSSGPLPATSQHALASALEDVTKDVRAVPRHTVTSASDTQPPPVSDVLGGVVVVAGGGSAYSREAP